MVVDCGVALIGQDELASGQHPEMYYETAGAASPVSTTRAVVVAHRVLADAPTADDPEVSGGISVLKSAHKRPNGIVELSASWFAANAEHRDAAGCQGIEAQWICEIGIETHKKPPLAHANGEKLLICRTRQPLRVPRRDVVASCSESLLRRVVPGSRRV